MIEMPWELGVPDDHLAPVWTVDASEEVKQAGLTTYLETHEGPPTELACWLRFRSAKVTSNDPLWASEQAFGHLDIENEGGRFRKGFRAIGRRLALGGLPTEKRTVVLAYIPDRSAEGREEEILSRQFTTALSSLNNWLISLGISHDDRLRPLSIGDLPSSILIVPVAVQGGIASHGPERLVTLRDDGQTIRTYRPEELETVQLVLELVSAESGLASFYELVQRAGSSRRAHRHREAVIDYATAGELFITEMLLAIGERRSVDEKKLENLRDGSFKDRAIHLCRQLKLPDDPKDGDSPLFLWWSHCYLQRNRIVHEGADSIPMLSEAGRMGLVTLVVQVRDAVASTPDIADFAVKIQWGYLKDETGTSSDFFPPVVK